MRMKLISENLKKEIEYLQLASRMVGMQNAAARMNEDEFVHRRPTVLATRVCVCKG